MSKYDDPRDERIVLEDVPELERSSMYVASWEFGSANGRRFFMPRNKFESARDAVNRSSEFADEFVSAIENAIDGGFEEMQFEIEQDTLTELLAEWPRWIVRSAVWNRDPEWIRFYWLGGGPLYDPKGRSTKEG